MDESNGCRANFGKESKDMKRTITKPRPGHADLNGAIKYGHRDIRNVLERSSARETTVRVAAGAVAKQILSELGVEIAGHVLEIGGVKAKHISNLLIEEIQTITENSPVRCLDKEVEQEMMNAIDNAKVVEIQSVVLWKSLQKVCRLASVVTSITIVN